MRRPRQQDCTDKHNGGRLGCGQLDRVPGDSALEKPRGRLYRAALHRLATVLWVIAVL